jgi:hypothetical protein
VVVDALSRKYEEEGSLFALSLPVPYWNSNNPKKNGSTNDTMVQLIQNF